MAVTFALDGEPRILRPASLEGWIDRSVMVAVNELNAASGRQFTVFQGFDQTAYVMALTPAERRAFEARSWCFL